MARPATGRVIERDSRRGRVFALRFTAYGERRYVTLGTRSEGWTVARAEQELADTLTLVRKGIWRPPVAEPTPVVRDDPTFHVFASEWLEAKRQEGLGKRTLDDYEWALSYHLLPFFQEHRLSEITVREVDRYKQHKARERATLDARRAAGDKDVPRGLSANTTNKTITRLAQILEVAAEYDLIPGNPASGKRRRLKAERPRRRFVQPEQVPALLRASDGYLGRRGRPLLATLAGAGLRIQEALDLERRHVNLARGTLTVQQSKTDAGVRVVDLTPALRDELALWLDRSPFKQPTDLVFPTSTGGRDSRQNVRKRLLVKSIERANVELDRLGIEPIGSVPLHGLRRTYATLRVLAGDDVVYVSSQIGHENPTFTLAVYAQAVKHREKLTAAERKAFDEAIDWARMGATVEAPDRAPELARIGTNGDSAAPVPVSGQPQ
jgi:integrase